jgi:hypothetical protein
MVLPAPARAALDAATAAGGSPDPEAFEFFSPAADGALAISEVYARTGPQASVYETARRAASLGRDGWFGSDPANSPIAGASAVWNFPFPRGQAFELTVNGRYQPDRDIFTRSNAGFAFVASAHGGQGARSGQAVFNPFGASFQSFLPRHSGVQHPLPPTFLSTVRCDGQALSMLVDDKPVGDPLLPPQQWQNGMRIGLIVGGPAALMSDAKIRRINAAAK